MHGINPLPLLGTRQRILCAIGVVVTSVPSKHLWRVRVSYGAPNRKSHTAIYTNSMIGYTKAFIFCNIY